MPSLFTCRARPVFVNTTVLEGWRSLVSTAVGVSNLCHDPDSSAFVIQARSSKRPDGVRSGYNSPAAVIPQRGKVSNNSNPASKSEHWRVLHEDVSRSYVANDSSLLAPQA